MKNLEKLKFFTLLPRSSVSPGQKVIGSGWVYKMKANNTHKQRVLGSPRLEPSARERLWQHTSARLFRASA